MVSNTHCINCNAPIISNDYCKEHFIASIEDTVKTTIQQYNLFDADDSILVAYSGGKDSTVLLSILHKLGYTVEAITVNAYIGCYSKESVANATTFCDQLAIPLHHISLREEFGYSLCYIQSLLKEAGKDIKSCSVCGVLRRYLLNKHARRLGATKIAFGHNLDDEAQVVLLNLFKGNPSLSARLGPRTGIQQHTAFIPRVKPLYLIAEKDITLYSQLHNFPVKYGDCPCSTDSFRYSIKKMLRSQNEIISRNIIQSFLTMLPILKGAYATTDPIGSCIKCNEPSQQKLCKSCDYMTIIKNHERSSLPIS